MEGTRQLGLAQAQSDEREELEDEAGAVKNQINRNEALEGETQGQRPTQSADKDADPGHAAAVAAEEDGRQKAVGGHGDGQACVAHHEGVEHAHAADDAAGDDRQAEQRSAERACGNGPGAGGKTLRRESGGSHGGQRKHVGEGGEQGSADHGAGVVALGVFDLARDGGGVVPAHVVPERH